jgi:hypothetical protein
MNKSSEILSKGSITLDFFLTEEIFADDVFFLAGFFFISQLLSRIYNKPSRE